MKIDFSDRPAIVHGPSNVGGYAGVMARTQRAAGLNAVSICLPSPYDFETDYLLAQHSEPKISFSDFFLRHYLRFDVFHIYYDQSFFGPSMRDLKWLKRLGKKIVMTFLGCDIRNPYLEMERSNMSMCAHCQFDGCSPNRETLMAVAAFADDVFVTTPDLLRSLPKATWFPLVADRGTILAATGERRPKYEPGSQLRIFHAPTDRIKKGSKYLEKSVSALQGIGVDVALIAADSGAQEDIWRVAAGCHLAFDQILSGVYGSFSVEMMAANVPVIAAMDREVWGLVGDEDCSGVICASPSTLTDLLHSIYKGDVDLAEVSDAGLARFNAWHTPEYSAALIGRSYSK